MFTLVSIAVDFTPEDVDVSLKDFPPTSSEVVLPILSFCQPLPDSIFHLLFEIFFCFSGIVFPSLCKMKKRNEKTNTGEGGEDKRVRTVSDDTGGKSLSDTSTSACGQCVGESSTGAKSTVIGTSVNIFEASKRDKPQYFVDVVKDKRRTKNNNLEFLIGWRGFPDPRDDTWEPLDHLSGSEHMIREFNEQWEKDYVRKTAETLQVQADRRKSAAEKNTQRDDIDETMGEGGGDEEVKGILSRLG